MMQAEIEETEKFAALMATDAARAEEALIQHGNPLDWLAIYTDDIDLADYSEQKFSAQRRRKVEDNGY